MDTVDKFCSTVVLQTGFKRSIRTGSRGRVGSGVSDAKLTTAVDNLWMVFGLMHRLWIT